MAHKKKHAKRVPPANRPQAGTPDATTPPTAEAEGPAPAGAPLQEQDEKRRIGNYTGAGEPSFQQPGGRNDADH